METTELIGGFKHKFEKFVNLFKQTKEENIRLKQENEKFRLLVEEKEEEIIVLKNKIETINLTNSFLNSGSGSKDAKNKINKIVREIDNCIALLNR